MHKTTIYDWNIFNCPFPANMTVYTAPELWMSFINNKRASGLKLDTREPIMIISSKIKSVKPSEGFTQLSSVETNNNKYYFFGPPTEDLINYLANNNYKIPQIWNGEEITKAIEFLLQI